MRRLSLPTLVLVASLSGCSKHTTEATAPPPAPPIPEVVATQPPARSASALYDSDIWAQFDRPLDPHTVTTQNVYLKLDAQRIPITVSYDGITQRVVLKPMVALDLQRTYTVDFSTAVKGADGEPLPSGVFFQFTTNSLRRPVYDYPVAPALEGPLATLGWGGTQIPVNNIVYELYASTDSAAVLARTAPRLARSVFTRFLPATAWPMGSTIYWSVTSENQTTHERLDGSMQSFRTLDPGTPLDSITIQARDHGSRSQTSSTQQCNSTFFSCGGAFNGAVHWDVSQLPADARLQSATFTMTISPSDTATVESAQPALWMSQNDWVPCSIISPGPPYTELSGFLATSTPGPARTASFRSDRLTGLLEAQLRSRTMLYGTLVRAAHVIAFHSTVSGDIGSRPSAVVRFYRVPPVPAP